MDHAIATEGLRRRFGRLDAVNNLTLHVPAGSIFGLIGPNGAGKTTTLKLLMNIIRPTAGHAKVLGVDSQRLGPAEFAKIGYVSENQRMPDWMTVRQLLAYCKPFYPAWDDGLSARLVDLMALPLDRKIKHLSRGMRMKAALVSSLAYRPRLLILDEPFSGLDPLMRDEFVQGVLELAGEGGWSAVISSHDLEDIERLIDWVGYLRDGQLAFSESIASLQSRFRQVDLSLSNAPADAPRADPPTPDPPTTGAIALPNPIPAAWLNVTTGDRAVRFVHARYVPEATEQELRARFPGAQIQLTPISLRETFIALARQERAAALDAHRTGEGPGIGTGAKANAGKLVLS
jgi:ABC-2 type transport system ATP-binding protein